MKIINVFDKIVDYLKTSITDSKTYHEHNFKSANTNMFTEIDLPDKFQATSYEEEKIIKRNQKSPYTVFKEMRASSRAKIHYYINEGEIFVHQAKFMVNFTDNYELTVPLDTYFTTYEHMDDAQLRTYFTWRTKVRLGCIENTSISYAFCYIFELINNIGVENPIDCIAKLLFFWNNFRVHDAKIDYYLRKWIRDYFIVNLSKNDFDSIGSRFPIDCTENKKLLDRLEHNNWDLSFVETHSKYKISERSFYKKGNKKIIENCVSYVFVALENFFKSNEFNLIDIYISAFSSKHYTPFQGAVYLHKDYCDIVVNINKYETYKCEKGKWSFSSYSDSSFRETKGYILKSVEIEIRKAFGAKQNLAQPIISVVSEELRGENRTWNKTEERKKKLWESIKSKDFKQTIQDAALAYCKALNTDNNTTKINPIKIDLSKLDKIREEHESTAKKLIIDEYLEEQEQVLVITQTVNPSGFTGFVDLLSNEESILIVTLLNSKQQLKNCELLIESINEKSLITIDDNIIGYVDGIPFLYKEYEDDLESLLGGNL